MKIQGIYAIRHDTSGRVYVGSAVDVHTRWHIHRHHLRRGMHHSPHLQAAWDKDGADAFTFAVLEAVPIKKRLIAREQWWIDELNACFREAGFNASPHAGSPLGTKHTDATKTKMRVAKLGKPAPWNSRKHTEEQNRRHSLVMTGRKRGPHAPETIAKMSAIKVGKSHSPETRGKLSQAWIERRSVGVSTETRAKLSRARKGNQNALGYRHTEDSRAKMAASQSARRAREAIERTATSVGEG